ncbi:uncharacterized protein EV154DRAFT_552057 [Mucor mucedo]|uniref:uncharacterized protein n=1 Tax=Mucor mucedo TaxID=29922 RepID=UPI00221FB020|nr:uncharacterized protein EV154DRAFT_552057 [Mucor mucedo]KAI7890764.1 hypothetical protein EV154DRAFT_552057 [Mucor mucedo]
MNMIMQSDISTLYRQQSLHYSFIAFSMLPVPSDCETPSVEEVTTSRISIVSSGSERITEANPLVIHRCKVPSTVDSVTGIKSIFRCLVQIQLCLRRILGSLDFNPLLGYFENFGTGENSMLLLIAYINPLNFFFIYLAKL